MALCVREEFRASKEFTLDCKQEFGDDYEMYADYCASLYNKGVKIMPWSEAEYRGLVIPWTEAEYQSSCNSIK